MLYSYVWIVYISCTGKVYHLFFPSLKEKVGLLYAINFNYGGHNAWDNLKCLWLCGFEDWFFCDSKELKCGGMFLCTL